MDNNARIFADGTDILCLHLEYPMVNVVQTRSEGTHLQVGSWWRVSSDAEEKATRTLVVASAHFGEQGAILNYNL